MPSSHNHDYRRKPYPVSRSEVRATASNSAFDIIDDDTELANGVADAIERWIRAKAKSRRRCLSRGYILLCLSGRYHVSTDEADRLLKRAVSTGRVRVIVELTEAPR